MKKIMNIISFLVLVFFVSCSHSPPNFIPVDKKNQALLGLNSLSEKEKYIFKKKVKEQFDLCNEKTVKKLEQEGLFFDENCIISWTDGVERNKITPVDSIEKKSDIEEMKEDSVIIFKPHSDHVNDVVFSHPVHNYWLSCQDCHYGSRRIFKPNAGSNPITMKKIATGEYCGVCHGPSGKTDSFNLYVTDSCLKCHRMKKIKLGKNTIE